MFKKLFEKIFPTGRRSRRQKIDDVHDILLFVENMGFKLNDISLNGLAIKDEGKFNFVVGKTYKGNLEIFNEDQCPIQVNVTRKVDGIIGMNVVNSPEYTEFFNDVKSRALAVKDARKK